MGLFNFGGAKPEIKDEKEAFLAIIYAAIAADGVVEQEEMNALAVTLANKSIFKGIDLNGTFKRINKIHKESGSVLGIIEASASKISNEYKNTVFAVATDFLLSDGNVSAEEEKMLYDLKAALNIPDELAKNIVDVIVIKNK
ncbi:MAG TPA: tellurite resistance TerB family protein [Bacteroidales bacterium]|nr:tellurite resistance TerB family protein [Bacteroidales bacterium]